ncbi:MAG: 16S rRNA (cytosine(967)-C(5))-methyltransferase RsmB [Pseudomonadales bacterium]
MTSPARERASAARLLRRVVVERRTTDQAMSGRDVTPLTQELVLGCLRHWPSLEQRTLALLDKPLRKKDRDIELLMVVGVYQLAYLRIPDHAAINETVKACRELGKPWATGLVNAVLRQVARTAVRNDDDPAQSERSFEHPEWLESALRTQYSDAEALMIANNQRAPMALRINRLRSAPLAYEAQLTAAGLGFRRLAEVTGAVGPGPETVVLLEPVAARRLPGFAAGAVAVQDAGAQFAAPLLAEALAEAPTTLPGARVLDACAAPGGKLFHLHECCPDLALTALESRAERLQQMAEEARRLGHAEHLDLREADATTLDWWDGAPYQAILLDAPCTGTGTLRRHPDIKLLRRAADVAEMAGLQARLLANLWRVLAPGGTLLYCTCSILAAENDEVVDAFLAAHDDATAAPLALTSGRAVRHGWQLLPTDPDTDGFYFSRLQKARSDKATS